MLFALNFYGVKSLKFFCIKNAIHPESWYIFLISSWFYFFQFSPVGHYFATASHDRTARIWSMERIQPLRVMAGHLSDVDVSKNIDISIYYKISSAILYKCLNSDHWSCFFVLLFFNVFSACNGIQTVTTSWLVRATKQSGYGMCSQGNVHDSS